MAPIWSSGDRPRHLACQSEITAGTIKRRLLLKDITAHPELRVLQILDCPLLLLVQTSRRTPDALGIVDKTVVKLHCGSVGDYFYHSGSQLRAMDFGGGDWCEHNIYYEKGAHTRQQWNRVCRMMLMVGHFCNRTKLAQFGCF